MHILILICVLTTSHSFIITKNDLHGLTNLATYIVHVELPDPNDAGLATNARPGEDLESWYKTFLPTRATTTASPNEVCPRMVYSYHNVFKGFAAKLSAEDVKEMEKKPGFISARPQKLLSLSTTHTPNFLGLHQNLGFWRESSYGKGVIIGVVDTGIVPDHPSFSDEGMPPPPAKWKGKCELSFSACNNKLIGARYFRDGDGSPMDESGHGTHTASIAAGNHVKGANVLGNANGTAVGVAPLAHLAIYKVCSRRGCSESDILAGIDAAIEDGVDILSVSLVGGPDQLYDDSISLGAYGAMEKGILVSCSAGNDGPSKGSLSNKAPWVLTVGASTTDRNIRASAVLGNKEEFHGETTYQPRDFPPTLFPLLYPGKNQTDFQSRYCASGSLNNTEVRGKIVVCIDGGKISGIEKGQNIKAAGGVGMILINLKRNGYTTFADVHVLPATLLSYVDGMKVMAYINSTESPMAAISFKGTIFGDNHAPMVASFSSRGPNRASPGILKPDIIGPGVNILAAWHRPVENNTNTKFKFNILSGTSMSCPHLSGVAALLKSVHPNWSPAAIKSAIMTTADLVNLAKNPIEDQRHHPANMFATGSGHVNPSRANNPGLIYDIEPKDYIPYLCGLNYTNREVGLFLKHKVNCAIESSIPDAQLNYPSFSIVFGSPVQTYTRTVTNVGEAISTYTVKIIPPAGVNLTIKPRTLSFSEANQKMTYEVTFTLVASTAKRTMKQGSLTWTSATYTVRSPIVVIINGK